VTERFRVTFSAFAVPNLLVVDAGIVIGSNVELYGVVGPCSGAFTVQIDNGPPRTLNATRQRFSPRMVLYQDSGLGPGQHTLRVTNAPFSGQTLSIDHAVVWKSLSL